MLYRPTDPVAFLVVVLSVVLFGLMVNFFLLTFLQ